MIGQVLIIVAVVSVSMYLYALMSVYGEDGDEGRKKDTRRRPHKRPVKRGGVLYTWH